MTVERLVGAAYPLLLAFGVAVLIVLMTIETRRENRERAARATCPGYEMTPNPCRCPCYGCKHHCAAHEDL